MLNRWYRRSPKAFHVIFNAAYNLELSPRKVTAQFENHLRLFGGNAFREYEEVFSVPFDDPQGAYEEMRRVIENQAEALGVEVVRLTEENAWERSEIVGSGRKARAQATRDIYKALVRKRRLEQAVQGRNGLSEQTGSGQSLSMLRGHAISRGSEVYEEVVGIKGPASFPFPRAGQQLPVTEESFSPYSGALPALNSKHPPCTLTPSSSLPSTPLSQQTRSTTPPVLAFRVFSTSSRSQLTPTGFRSELFQNWVGPITQPLPQTTPLFNVLALNHFSMRSQCSSAFISCAISLIQVLNKPVAKGHGENPQLCLIDLTQLYENPEENKASQVYSAQHVIQDLKNKGQMNWRRNRHGNGQMSPTRYKGLSEYIVWGEIPAEAVISAVSLAEIADVAGEFLCFECFTAGRHTGAVADEIKEKGIALGMKEARKMGELARLVGLAQAESVVQLAHVSAFIAALVDGWYIRSEGTQSPSVEVAMSFARALNSHVFTNKEVIDAFFQGVRRGLENVGYFEGRRWSK